MSSSHDDLVERLEVLSEEIAERAIAALRRSIEDGSADGATEERRLTRARRAVDKAASLLAPPPQPW